MEDQGRMSGVVLVTGTSSTTYSASPAEASCKPARGPLHALRLGVTCTVVIHSVMC
jgi:hypothetical protein